MKESLLAALRPVRARQQLAFTVRCLFAGLLAAAAVGVAVGLGRVAFGLELSWPALAGVLAVGPLVGLIVGLVVRRTEHDAAAAIDGHYGLKDRTVTALAFADTGAAGDLHALQYSDAMTHLTGVEPKAVVPVKAPKTWPAAVVGLVAAATLAFWPLATRDAEAGPAATPEHIDKMAKAHAEVALPLQKKLEEMIQDTDELTDEEKQGIKDLLEKAKEKIEELAQDSVSEQEALAKLSELSAQKEAMATLLNAAALEGALSSLGSALATSQPFEGAGKALQKGDLEKAAKEFDKLSEVTLTPKEAKDLEQKLREQQKKSGDAGQGSLSDAIGELADAIKGGGTGSKVGQAGKGLSKRVNAAIRKRKVANLLDALDENNKSAKCDCQNSGGPKAKNRTKSDSPSSNWGRGVSGNEGDRTKSIGKRNEVQVTGTPGDDGDSETETTTTPEARQKASKDYQQKFQKGKKESQAVLESEPIPLGHRQTVKKYFEMIRPSTADAFDTKKDEPKAAEKKDEPKAGEKK